MGLNIKNETTVSKVRRLAKLKRKGITEVIDEVVSRELQRLQPGEARRRTDTLTAIRRIQRAYAAGAVAATGTPDEIIGYNARGHFD